MKVELIDHMGSDLSVVNAARVSFDKESTWEVKSFDREDEAEDYADIHNGSIDYDYVYSDRWMGGYPVSHLKEADKRLIQFLARGMTTDDFEELCEDLREVFTDYSLGGTPDICRDEIIRLLWQWRRNPTHFTPFAHPHVTFRIEMPIFIARQLEKHQVGFVWSEVSRRYVDEKPTFFRPEYWRKRADNIKQGSSDDKVYSYQTLFEGERRTIVPEAEYEELLEHAEKVYTEMIEGGVCPEQARIVLPQSMMTMWVWTGSLYGWANVYNQRKPGSHAQREVWPFAQSLADHMTRLFPVSWEALTA